MNWVDLLIILVLIFFTLEGLGKPFISEVIDFLSFLVSFSLGLEFYNLASNFLEIQFKLPRSFANILGFLIIWYLFETIFLIISRQLLSKKYELVRFKGDQFLSLVPSFLRGVVFVSIILILIGAFPIQPKVKKDVNDSVIGSWILNKTLQYEMPLKQIFGDLASSDINFITIEPKEEGSVDLGFKTDNFHYDQNMETEMINLVNQERTNKGLSVLKYDKSLQKIARDHSSDMFKRGYFSHYSPENQTVANRASQNNIDFLVIGENLAYAPNLLAAHKGLMNSPGHRDNILSTDYHKIGIGIANANEYGIMFTQVFTN